MRTGGTVAQCRSPRVHARRHYSRSAGDPRCPSRCWSSRWRPRTRPGVHKLRRADVTDIGGGVYQVVLNFVHGAARRAQGPGGPGGREAGLHARLGHLMVGRETVWVSPRPAWPAGERLFDVLPQRHLGVGLTCASRPSRRSSCLPSSFGGRGGGPPRPGGRRGGRAAAKGSRRRGCRRSRWWRPWR